jgi:hypothetical protein
MTYDRSKLVMHPKPNYFVPEPVFLAEHRYAGHKRCKAWSLRNGRQCGSLCMLGKEVCYQHGGATPHGIASPNWVHGRSSKYLPARLQETYLTSMQDKELLALRHEISVVDARIDDLFQRVDIGESGHLWLKTRELLIQLRSVLIKWDTNKLHELLITLDDLVHIGITDYAAWNEISNSIELRRRLVETERKRLVDMQQMITAEQAIDVIGAITTAVKENVTDPTILRRIQTAIIRITNKPGL